MSVAVYLHQDPQLTPRTLPSRSVGIQPPLHDAWITHGCLVSALSGCSSSLKLIDIADQRSQSHANVCWLSLVSCMNEISGKQLSSKTQAARFRRTRSFRGCSPRWRG
jgi:hypothetical protein